MLLLSSKLDREILDVFIAEFLVPYIDPVLGLISESCYEFSCIPLNSWIGAKSFSMVAMVAGLLSLF